MERTKKKLFRRVGRAEEWQELNRKFEELVSSRRKVYVDNQREKLTSPNATKRFYKIVKDYQCAEKPEQFDVRELYPGLSDEEVSEELAGFFNQISSEFEPLDPVDIPITHNRELPPLEEYQVAGRVKAFKKPDSMVLTDVFPKLVTDYADVLAIPLTSIYNEIL